MLSQPLVKVTRGNRTESLHHGYIAVTDAAATVLYAAGNPDHLTYARSAAKPLQAIPIVESGAAERFGLTDAELALICASHNGEEAHTALAAGMLARLGLDAEALQCGVHEPFYKPAADALKRKGVEPTALHNNCSGKHSGMLALALAIGASPEGYLEPEHPVQQRMLEAVSGMSGVPAEQIPLGIDGCGVPVFALPLSALATAFARLGRPDALPEDRAAACRRVTEAIRTHPWALAGTGRYDTRLLEATGGRLIGKLGAEGVFAVAVPERGWGVAVKIEDGGVRALYPAVTEALRQLDLLAPAELAELAEFHRPQLRNWQGMRVGGLEPDFTLAAY